MRLAIVAAAGAEPTPDPALGERDATLLKERLEMDDLGFDVHLADPGTDLAEQIDALLRSLSETPDALLYASCALAVVEDGDCFLCLNPAEPDVGDSLRDVAGVLADGAARALLVLELRYDDAAADRRVLSEVVDALRACVPTSVELIAAVRPMGAHPERIPSRLSAALLEAIDAVDGPLNAKQAYAEVIQKADLGSWPHAATYVAGKHPLELRRSIPARPPAGVSAALDDDLAPPAPLPPPDPAERIVPEFHAGPSPSVATAAPAALVTAAPDTPQAPEPSQSALRPAPPSERRQSTTVSMPVRKKPSSQPPESLPKVLIGDSRPSPSSGPTPISSPAPMSAEPQPRRRMRSRELFDTLAEGPDAKRAKADSLPQIASSEGVTTEPSIEGADDEIEEISVEIARPSDQEAVEAAVRAVKKPADMSVEEHIEEGDAHRSAGDLDRAVEEYKRALGKLGTDTGARRASVYLRIAEVTSEQGNTRVAISNYDKALSIQPDNALALDALIRLNAAEGNWRAVHKMEERFLGSGLEPELRYGHLVASAERWRGAGADPKRAKERFYQAHELFNTRALPIEGLLAIYEADRAIDRVIELRQKLIEIAIEPRERARKYYELGEYLMFEAGRERDGLSSFEKAIETDPSMLEALELLATALADGQEWGELERVYQKMIDEFTRRTASDDTRTVLAELYRRLALLYRDHLEDPESALAALEQELRVRPYQLSGQLLAAEVALEAEAPKMALEHLRIAATLDPQRSETYHQLFAVGRMCDDLDAAFLASSVATLLGAADDRERVLYRQLRLQGVPSLRRTLREHAWKWLKPADHNLVVDEVMRALCPIVLTTRVRQLQSEGRLPPLPQSGPQDPESSTISVMRTVAWACEYLGVARPEIYVSEEAPGTLSAPFATQPAVLIGREVLSGRTLLELAFLVGRHVAMRLPEHELVAHMQSIDELSACFLAALKIVLGNAPASKLGAAVEVLAPMLSSGATEEQLDTLDEAVHHFEAAGGRVNLNKWVGSVELCATRTGLLLCGDLETAVTAVRSGDSSPFATVERRLEDLYSFTVSRAHAELRRELGSALGEDKGRPELTPRP